MDSNETLFDFLFARDPETHKGDYGHALLVAGSYAKMGAAVLAARACLRSGVGLLTVHVPRRGVDIMQTAVPEAMVSVDDDDFCFSTLPKHLERYEAVALGPGLGTEERTQSAMLAMLEARQRLWNGSDAQPSAIIDADALNILSRHPEWLHLANGGILTPHDGEYQRLFGDNTPQTMADLHGVVIVKKAHRTTVYAPHHTPRTNATGNAGMATAGSGDVLTGIMLGIAAQAAGYGRRHPSHYSDPADYRQRLAAMAVHIHGAAGDKAAQQRAMPSLIASDIIENILR